MAFALQACHGHCPTLYRADGHLTEQTRTNMSLRLFLLLLLILPLITSLPLVPGTCLSSEVLMASVTTLHYTLH